MGLGGRDKAKPKFSKPGGLGTGVESPGGQGADANPDPGKKQPAPKPEGEKAKAADSQTGQGFLRKAIHK